MQVSGSESNGVLVLKVDQPMEIDVGNAEAFKAGSLESMGNRGQVVLDAASIDFFDSAGMGALLSLKKKALEHQGDLVLACLRQPILEIFQVVGFDSIFKIFPDVPAAVSHFHEG